MSALCQAFGNVVDSAMGHSEKFTDVKPMSAATLVAVVLYLLLVLFVGKYLWNEVMCKVVSVCKPMPSLLHLLGLILLLDLLRPSAGCNCN